MAKRSVHWEEGAFVTPHHFQAAERYLHDRLRETEDWLIPNSYGVVSLRLDESALSIGTLKVLECRVRLKDGSTLEIPGESRINEIGAEEIQSTFGQNRNLTAWIAVPQLQEGRKNLFDADNRDARYEMQRQPALDENTGEKDEIDFRFLRAKLILGGNARVAGLEMLPICRVTRSDQVAGQYVIDKSFVPSLLDINAWPWLKENVEQVHKLMESWIEQESRSLEGINLTFESPVEGRGVRILRLAQICAGWASLQSILYDRRTHPQPLYLELCRILGQLSIFGPMRKPPSIPAYDHDDIGPHYLFVLGEIRKLLEGIGRIEYERRPFVFGVKDGEPVPPYRVELDPKWDSPSYELYLGVETSGVPHADVDDIIKRTNYKLGAREKVKQMCQGGLPGLEVKPLNRIPPKLSGVKNTTFFTIERSPEQWRDVTLKWILAFWYIKEGTSVEFKNGTIVLTHPVTKKEVPLSFSLYVTHADGSR